MVFLHVILLVLSARADEGDVVELTNVNFDKLVTNSEEMWLIEFYAPWCGQCQKLAPEWSKAATELKGQVKLGKVDCTVEDRLATRFEIEAYPTINVFPPLDKSGYEKYEGQRTADDIVKTALELLAEHSVLPEVPQLTAHDMFADCESYTLCVVAFLPHIYDSSAVERTKYIEVVQKVSARFKSKPLKFFWAQQGDFYKLEDKLGLGFGFPAVIGIALQKNRFAVMRTKYTDKEVLSFVEKVISGSYALTTYSELPKLGVVEPWDGKDQEYTDEDL